MNLKKILKIALVLIVILSFGATYANDDTVDYAVTQMARNDYNLFSKDFVTQADSNAFTPKYFNDMLMVILLKLGISWKAGAIILYLFATIILSCGLVEIADAISGKFKLTTAVFLAMAVMYLTVGKAFGMNYLWRTSYTVQSISMALIVLSLGNTLKQQALSWKNMLLPMLSVIFNVQLGTYAAIMIGVMLISRHGLKSIIWVCPAIMTAAIMFALVSTRSDSLLNNKQFIDIYARLRNPHHLVPSHWDVNGMISFIAHMAALFLLGYSTHIQEKKRHFREWMAPAIFLFLAGVTLFAACYLFIEKFPWAVIAKIYPGRYFILLRLAGIVYAAKIIDQLLHKEQYAWVFMFALCMLHMPSETNWIWLSGIALGIYLEGRSENNAILRSGTIATFFCAVIAYMAAGSFLYWDIYSVMHLSVYSILIMKENAQTNLAIMITVGIIFSQLALYNERYLKSGIQNAIIGTTTSAYGMANYIRDNTPIDSLILCDPYDQAYNDVRLFGERSLVVSWKVVPTSDEAIIEWVNRLVELNCLKIENDKYVREYGFNNLDSTQLNALIKKYDIDYIIVQNNTSNVFVQRYNIVYEQDGYILIQIKQ